MLTYVIIVYCFSIHSLMFYFINLLHFLFFLQEWLMGSQSWFVVNHQMPLLLFSALDSAKVWCNLVNLRDSYTGYCNVGGNKMTLVPCKSGGGGVGTLEYVLIENHYRCWILLSVYTLPIIIPVNTWESKCISHFLLTDSIGEITQVINVSPNKLF